MIIKSIEIRGLWGSRKLKWDLTSEVSVLSGINGAGKSTVLRALGSLLVDRVIPGPYLDRFRTLRVTLEDDTKLTLLRHPINIEDLMKEGEEVPEVRIFVESLDDDLKRRERIANLAGVTMWASKGSRKLDIEEVLDTFDRDFISTFDFAPSRPKDPKQAFISIMENSHSELDRHLEEVIERYRSYQIELGTRLNDMITGANPNLKKATAIFEWRTEFQDRLDDMMKMTGKLFNRTKGEVEFIFDADGKSHTYEHLSAGEKQLLLILLTVFLQERRRAVLIMDEPEISLHVEWQKRLLTIIREINPNCQVIVATHSPMMIIDGWRSNVTNIKDLITSRN